ncbi:MAG: chromosome segregation protein SMC [Xenococcaceae cyanobacterium]
MVHIKRVELSHFKSFGGTTQIPLLPGFTVVSGPNGSGKSNILDALLFCLGLSTSKGMRAERLPDLVNHKQSNNRRSAETSVSVTLDLSDWGDLDIKQREEGDKEEISQSPTPNPQSLEWTVTRRLRVTKGGNYASTYYMNGQPCTATELHEQLNRLRIYPEGYNVVLQGDVTRIITMNSRERREIIDELAGVAEFDRKINQTKKTLEAVKEREDRCRIIEQELIKTRDRLAADRIKAEKYQKLKAKIQEKQQWEVVLIWRSLQQQEQQQKAQIAAGETEEAHLKEQLNTLATQISQATTSLDQLNSRVKALGEEEQLSVASKLATQKAKHHQLQQRQQELETIATQNKASIERTGQEIEQYQQTSAQLTQEKSRLETEKITSLSSQRNQARETLAQSREKANAIAAASEAWVQEQTAFSREIASLQKTLNPQRTEQAQLTERHSQLQKKIEEQTQLIKATEQEIATKRADVASLSTQVTTSDQQVQSVAQQLAAAEQARSIQQDTQTRLLKEQREKQRQLDKLEATNQAQQEAQGTYATKVILQANLPGVCGLVAQLGQVDPRYQLALETSAGGRLGYIVVEDDGVAAAGIELLKQKRAGRATFLPLNKIQLPRLSETVALRYARGFIDLAVNLINCQPRYRNIFAYVFGSTVVFETLNDARPYLGKNRIVTLEGEILESSGAMTGGSKPNRSSLHFGTATAGESGELKALKRRLDEIEQILQRGEELVSQGSENVKQLTEELTEARQQRREQQLHLEQLQREIEGLTGQKEQLNSQLAQNRQQLDTAQNRLQVLAAQIPVQEAQLQQKQQRLTELEESQAHSEWQKIQTLIKAQEAQLQEREEALRQAEEQLKDLSNQYLRLEEKITESHQRLEEYQQRQVEVSTQQSAISTQLWEIGGQIAETEAVLQQLSEKLEEAKKERDRAEEYLRKLQNQQQQKSWQQQKLQETQQERLQSLQSLQQQIQAQQGELPDPLPEIPMLVASGEADGEGGAIAFESFTAQLEQLQKELRNAQKRLQAMEPVNMLALEEYDRTQARLEELSSKLTTLEAERTELLLRIENFTTLRFRAFKEAFDAVNENFQSIFASLSEGDGYLQLDDPENPFNGGLNLIAHPKGKPVQRLSSMSGGEKSLTALSFIFALQRYRPSPFYAFDEVDMFLDGANVERLARMIKKQAQQAQFIVVSLRRPMIESSERTIGVTQARGAYTQVLGIKL